MAFQAVSTLGSKSKADKANAASGMVRTRTTAAPGSDVGLHAGCLDLVQPLWLSSASIACQGSPPAAATAVEQEDLREDSQRRMTYSLLGLVGSEAPAGEGHLSHIRCSQCE